MVRRREGVDTSPSASCMASELEVCSRRKAWLHAVLNSEESALEKLIKEIDKDRDGKITNQELKVLNDSPFYLIAYSLDLFQGSHEQGREKAPCAAR